MHVAAAAAASPINGEVRRARRLHSAARTYVRTSGAATVIVVTLRLANDAALSPINGEYGAAESAAQSGPPHPSEGRNINQAGGA